MPNTTIQKLIEADQLQEALKRFSDFLISCQGQDSIISTLMGRLASLENMERSGLTAEQTLATERNKIRWDFLSALNDFRRGNLSPNFELGTTSEFLEQISNRDEVILKILGMRLLPKRFEIDQNWVKEEGNSSIIYRLQNIDTRRHAVAMVIKYAQLEDRLIDVIERLNNLRHRNVIKLIDYELFRFPYFVLTEYVYGQKLPQVLDKTGPRPPSQTADWLYQLTDALDYLRHKRVLHTNVRPSKIYIDDEWQIMISPFDLMRFTPLSSRNLNPERTTEITFSRYIDICQYGSPELYAIDGKDLDMPATCTSDLYSLGLIAYKILTGHDIFEGASLYEITENRRKFATNARHRDKKLSLLPESPLTDIILKLLAEDPAERSRHYPNLHALLRALHALTHADIHETDDIQSSYRRCLAVNKEFIRDFYIRLADTMPETRNLFNDLSIKRQAVMLQLSIDMLIAPDGKHEYISRLFASDNRHHSSFTLPQFETFLDTLRQTVALNDPLWTSELDLAWRDVFRRAILTIKNIRESI